MEERLRAERPVHRAPESMTDRVMENLSSESPSIPGHCFAWPRFALGFATIAGVAALSLSVLRPPKEELVPRLATAAPREPLNISIPSIPTEHLEQLSLHLDQPLEKELQNVISDTRVAIQFVAASFLPEK